MNFRSRILLGFLLNQRIFSHGYNILVLIPFPAPSHHLMFKALIETLLARGHNITSINAIKINQNHSNYTQIYIHPEYPIFEKVKISDMVEGRFSDFNWLWLGLETSEWGLKDKKVQQLIRGNETSFDLIICEQFMQESWLMFSYKFKAPLITINTFGPSNMFDRIMGLMPPFSFIPHSMLIHYGDEMTFFQKLDNAFTSIGEIFVRDWNYEPKMQAIADKGFESLAENGRLPSIKQLENSISAIFVNSHFSFHKPKPLMPGIINIGGFHIKEPSPLPNDLNEFLNGADNGAIYFSLGSYLNSSLLNPSTLESIIKVFENLEQRIVWKSDLEDVDALPKNVFVRKWLPQSDILAHKNVILFISHGGLFSVFEAIHRAVPMLITPMYSDQLRNAKICETLGIALQLQLKDLTEKTFKSKISELIDNDSYRKKVIHQSQLFKDNPIKPMDNAIYWIEHVARTKGAKHLKSAAIHLTWYNYLCLDVLGFICAVAGFFSFLLLKFCKILIISQTKNKRKVQ